MSFFDDLGNGRERRYVEIVARERLEVAEAVVGQHVFLDGGDTFFACFVRLFLSALLETGGPGALAVKCFTPEVNKWVQCKQVRQQRMKLPCVTDTFMRHALLGCVFYTSVSCLATRVVDSINIECR